MSTQVAQIGWSGSKHSAIEEGEAAADQGKEKQVH
jgi:hypothetical protein